MRFLPTAFLALLVLGSSSPVRADSAQPPAPNEANTDVARKLYEDGRAFYRQKEFAKARSAFLAAWALRRHWQVAGNLGDSERRLGLFRDAAEHLAFAVRVGASDTVAQAQDRAQAQEDVSRMRAILDEVTREVATVKVSSTQSGSEIWLDGKHVGQIPLDDPMFLDPGQHTIETRAAGQSLTKISLNVNRGEMRDLQLPLSSRSTSTTAAGSSVVLRPETTSGFSSTRTVLLIAGTGTTLAAAGFGIWFLTRASAAQSDVDRLSAQTRQQDGPGACLAPDAIAQPVCTQLQQAADRKSAATSGETASWVMTGAFAAATAGIYVLWPQHDREAALVTPQLGPHGGAVVIHGTF